MAQLQSTLQCVARLAAAPRPLHAASAAAAAAAARPALRAAARSGRRPRGFATAAAAASAASAAAGPLSPSRRGALADKLTETAKNIVWTDKEAPAEASREQIQALEARLGYRWRNRWLLRLALVHSSAATNTHNSILAWVGDAALYLVVAEEVGGSLGYAPIGKLSEVRKTLIGRAMCTQYATHLGLEEMLVMGKSYALPHDGKASANMIAELFEAVMGAMYLDSDLEAVRRCYLTTFPLPEDPLVLLQPDGTGGVPRPAAGAGSAGGDSPWG